MNAKLIEYPSHSNNDKRDMRYTVAPEYMGYSVPLLAVRFCGELIGACRDELKANNVMRDHWKKRQAVLEGRA